ncbi:MAG: response regulator transcription factor [Candidatus Promineifilaceae bacterium]|nr:response regulator transcription factor [Candidatus Promineifilaceae bacterium]
MDPELLFMIVASDPLVRAGLAARIEARSECKVVSSVSPGEVLEDLNLTLEEEGATVVVWDWGLENSDASSVDFYESDIPVILLISEDLEIDEIWTTGAGALIKRDASGAEISATAVAVLHGKFVIDLELTNFILPSRPKKLNDLPDPPTHREQQVLQLMAEGYTNRAIAKVLDISEHTVKFHVNSIFGKLHVQSRTEAVVQATRLGLISL